MHNTTAAAQGAGTGSEKSAEDKPQAGTREGATPTTGDDQLGDAGKRALDAERQARKAAAREAADLRRQLDELRDAGRTDAEKQAAAIAAVQAELAQLRAERDRLAVSTATGVPADILRGPGEDLEAWARALADWKGAAPEQPAPERTEPAPPSWGAFNVTTPDKVTPTLPEQIDAAERAGDKGLVAALKASMLSGH